MTRNGRKRAHDLDGSMVLYQANFSGKKSWKMTNALRLFHNQRRLPVSAGWDDWNMTRSRSRLKCRLFFAVNFATSFVIFVASPQVFVSVRSNQSPSAATVHPVRFDSHQPLFRIFLGVTCPLPFSSDVSPRLRWCTKTTKSAGIERWNGRNNQNEWSSRKKAIRIGM